MEDAARTIASTLVSIVGTVLVLSLVMRVPWLKRIIERNPRHQVQLAEEKINKQKRMFWFFFWAALIIFTAGHIEAVVDRAEPRNHGQEVTVTHTDAAGIMPDNIAWTPELLKVMEANVVELLKNKIRADNPSPQRQEQLFSGIRTSSEYVENDGQKLIIVRLKHAAEKGKGVFISGFQEGKLVVVSCIDGSSQEEVSLVFGFCADKVRHVFGLSSIQNQPSSGQHITAPTSPFIQEN
ncbi:MAG: hypothetical protein RBT70_04140 [Alphaproteobacteria bacterium]|jgi:hypothetical protein|nr:hypothetical protein [Alphaproteobacteria bacterium]